MMTVSSRHRTTGLASKLILHRQTGVVEKFTSFLKAGKPTGQLSSAGRSEGFPPPQAARRNAHGS
jgi:hypothetical protein